MPLKKQTFGRKKFTSPQSPKKPSSQKGWNHPILPSSPKKKTLLEKKKKVPNPSSHRLKAPLIPCNPFNLIELSAPYTH
jgi:hypothetical protein